MKDKWNLDRRERIYDIQESVNRGLGAGKHRTHLKSSEGHLEGWGGKLDQLNSLQKC